MLRFVVFTCFIAAGAAQNSNNASSSGDGRVFSLFNIVQFPNDVCTTVADSTMLGTCFTKSECSSKGGTADGNCAAGFGVCCMFTISTCGSTVSHNITYVQNPSYSSSYSTVSSSCVITINRLSDVCQIRLDFKVLNLFIDTTGDTGAATSDSLTATSPTGVSPPVVSGTDLGDQHMIIETGTSSSVTVTIATGTTSYSRKWKIEVTQYECNTNYKAPEGCVQYVTGKSGNIKSFNHPGGQNLQKQSYSTCIRTEEGYCGIQYGQSANTSPDSFKVGVQTISTSLPGACPLGALSIPGGIGRMTGSSNPPCVQTYGCGTIPNEDYCGTSLILEPGAASTYKSVVRTYQQPFRARYYTDTSTQLASTGYNINYTQLPC